MSTTPTMDKDKQMTSHGHGHEHDHGRSTGSAGGGGGCGGHASSTGASAQASADEVTECPVMLGIMVIKSQAEEAGLYRDYQGQRYWLCCDACGPLFDAHPERYAAA